MAMMSYMHEIQTVYNVVQDPQMVLLSEKGAHGVGVRREKVCMMLPQQSQDDPWQGLSQRSFRGCRRD